MPTTQVFIEGAQRDNESANEFFAESAQFDESAAGGGPASAQMPWNAWHRHDPLFSFDYHWYQPRRLVPVDAHTPPIPQDHHTPPLRQDRQQAEYLARQEDVSPEMFVQWTMLQARRWPIPIHTPLEISQRLPFVPRDPDLKLPLRRFVDIVSQMVNSFLRTGQIVKTGQTSWRIERSAGIEASRAPTQDDDETQGYAVGQIWIDTGSGQAYIAVDVTEDGAVWMPIGGVAGGGLTGDF